ncbi:MAG: hypothetical protein RIR70_538 [Pseudomonadota bacterium]|jgi:hypothetical protein
MRRKVMRHTVLKCAAMPLVAFFGATGPVLAEQAAPNTPAPVAQPKSLQLQVLSSVLRIHEKPDARSEVIAQLRRGQVASVLAVEGVWHKIRLSSGEGWVFLGPGENNEKTFSLSLAKGMTRFARDEVGSSAAPEETITPERAGRPLSEVTLPAIDPSQVAPPQPNLPREFIAIPDRWRLMQSLGFKFPLYDPYNQNPLKGDLPVLKNLGPDWFFNLGVISDTLFEYRRLPTPVAGQVGIRPGANDVFGKSQQSIFAQTVIVSLGLIKGNTTFRPPDYEYRLVPVFNYNRVRVGEAGALNIDPSRSTTRRDNFATIQEGFFDVHLRNVSERYDFDSLRVGVQPITSDFRGFLFQDTAPGIRYFGNRDNNRYQFNLAVFRRAEKDTNSGLNDFSQRLRRDDVFLANLYKQDWPVVGFTSQGTIIHNINREAGQNYYDTNGFLVRPAVLGDLKPHNYKVTYLGYNGDGHFGRWNLTTSTYLASGVDERNPLAQQRQDIRAGFHASELSRDFDWIRVRGNFLYATGDRDPYDSRATGFDAIFENPQFAGADTSFFIRQPVPLIGGGGVALSGRNGVLPSLRSSKDQGQSNFVNPGLTLVGMGADFDIKPELRVLANISRLQFVDTAVLSALRNQAVSSRDLGTDVSVGFQYRPYFNQNVILNGSAAMLAPGAGLRDLYDEGKRGNQYSVLLNLILTF